MRGNLRLYIFGITFVLFFSVLTLMPPVTESKRPRDGKTSSTKTEERSGTDATSKPSSAEKQSARPGDKSKSLTKTNKQTKELFVPAENSSTAKPDESDAPEGDDPDRPRTLSPIDEGEYLRLREEHIAVLRGYEPGKPFDSFARGRALREMERQEAALAKATAEGTIRPEISGTTWTAIGPTPIPNGQVTGGGTVAVNGRVTAVAVHPTNPSTAYVGTAQGGLYRTLDGGATWTPLMDTAASLAIGAVTIDPVDPTKVFVGTGEGNLSLDSFFGVGVYRINSADTTPVINGPFETRVAGTGTTTAASVHAFAGTAINKIVVDPANDNRIFVGNTTGESGASGDSICCGAAGPPPSAFIGLYFCANALAASPGFSRVSGVAGSGQAGVTDIVFEPGSSDNLLLGSEDFGGGGTSGIYRTTNASTAPGASPTFTKVVTLGVVNSKLAIYKQGSAPTVVVLAATETSSGRLLQSTDGGATFPTTLSAVNGFCGSQCFYDIALAVDPGATAATADDIIYLGGSANTASTFVLKRSTDGGTTFSAIDTALHADFHALTLAPSDSAALYAGNDGGIFKSTNANTAIAANVAWSSLNNSTFNATQFESLAVHPTDANFTIGGTQDNGTECQGPCGGNPSGWVRADFGDGGFSAIDQNAANTTTVTMYHTYFNRTNAMEYARVTTTAAAFDGNWSTFGCGFGGVTANGMTCSATAILFYAPMALGPGNPNRLYFGSDVLYRSADSGTTMIKVSQEPITSNVAISAIGIAPLSDNVRIVGLKNGGIFATTTGLTTLTSIDPVGGGSVVPDKYVARAVIDPTDSNIAYVTLDGYTGSANHVWKTTNLVSGFPTPTWTNASGSGGTSIPDIPVNAFVIDPSNHLHLYAGTDTGVYISQNGGTSWSPFGAGLPRVAVFDMAIQNSNRILRIATHGKGMWEITPIGPTAAPAKISGWITTANGSPLAGVTMRLTGSGSATTITDSNGTYHFDNVDTDNFYSLTPSLANYHFNPGNRSFSLLGNKTDAVFTATPDAVVTSNAIDTNEYFVRQQYLDFLGREPDQGGFNYWTDRLNQCNADPDCLRQRRIDVSAAFFASQEFQETGSFVYRLYQGALGRQLSHGEFSADRSEIVGGPNLDVSKTTFANAFVARAEFIQKYQANISAESFVDALLQTLRDSAGVDLTSERGNLIGKYNSRGTMNESRALVLRDLGDNAAFSAAVYNPSFVLMEYFGYLQRGPDQGGYDFWLNVLNNEPGNYRGMVCAFITSTEYQRRFSSVVTRSDAECRK